jgi:uncharacterized membrane protein YgcG
MPQYKSDDALQEIHDEMYRQEEERPKSGLAELDTKVKFVLGIFVIFVVFLYFNKVLTQSHVILIILSGAIFLFLIMSSNTQRKELTWIECMIRINDMLKFLQNHQIGDIGQIPKGDIHVTPIGRKQWIDGKSFKRSYGVDISDDDKGIIDHFFLEVDVFTGDIITFKKAPGGVTGDETKDIKMIPSHDMLIQKKRDWYLGKGGPTK